MRVEKHSVDFPLEALFPMRELLIEREGGVIWSAEKENRYYLIFDESAMAVFLIPVEDDDLLDQLIKVFVFDTEAERESFIDDKGWRVAKG